MTAPTETSAESVRLAHLSDIHITTRPLGWRPADWWSKRVTGWLNLRVLGRAYRFRRAAEVLTALAVELRQAALNCIVFSGDATTLGFDAEFARAAALLGVGELPGFAVPGNHDYYTQAIGAGGVFERYFGPWLQGVRSEEATYPFARRVGPYWLVGVNSSTGNRWPWDASGRVGAAQLDRLDRLLQNLDPGPRILVTHYPYCLPNGVAERRSHRLHDRTELLDVAARGQVCLWLHGHRHDAYVVADPKIVPFPIVCSGSSTQTGYASYGAYTLAGGQLHIVRRVYSPSDGSFRDGATFDLPLPVQI